LPAGHDGIEIQRNALAVGINILSGTVFSPSKQYRNCIRIACGYPFDVLKPAIRTLSQIITTRPQDQAYGQKRERS
jgi:DNA-binding transcriptional MocR family regulator